MAAELQHVPEAPVHAVTATVPSPAHNTLGPPLAVEHQHRPSVRLGEISFDSHIRKTNPRRFTKYPTLPSKIPPLRNHETLGAHDRNFSSGSGGGNLLSSLLLNRNHKEPKAKRAEARKMVRSNWASRLHAGLRDDKFSRTGYHDAELRGFEPEGGSEGPLKEQSPFHSVDNVGHNSWHGHRKSSRARVSGSRERNGFELGEMLDSGDPKCGARSERNLGSGRGSDQFLDDGVRTWLIELGLSRYASIFEVHEVDEEILPLLTLEDLKDMGINAVGSRRRLHASIRRLREGLS